MSAEIPKGSRVMHVKRGNVEVVVPIRRDAFAWLPAHEIAALVVKTVVRLQAQAPDRATEPIRMDDTLIALRVAGRERVLDPNLSLREQTEGRWEYRDLPIQGQADATARLPVCQFELVDVERPVLHVG